MEFIDTDNRGNHHSLSRPMAYRPVNGWKGESQVHRRNLDSRNRNNHLYGTWNMDSWITRIYRNSNSMACTDKTLLRYRVDESFTHGNSTSDCICHCWTNPSSFGNSNDSGIWRDNGYFWLIISQIPFFLFTVKIFY
jgi:hypothetical protein